VAEGLPPSVRRGIAELNDLSPEQFDSLAATFETPFETLAELAAAAASVTNLEAKEARSIALTFTSLRQAYPRLEYLAEAAQRLVQPQENDDGSLTERATILLKSRAVTLLARATRLQLENRQNYSTAFIATDARPLFPNLDEDSWLVRDIDEPLSPYGAVILSHLRIDSFVDNELQSYFVAMDLDDLRSLAHVVDRAIKKHVALSDDIVNQGRLAMSPLGGE
jgi:hypothetical protein